MAAPAARRARAWLIGAAVLLAATALVAVFSEGSPPAPRRAKVEFPRHLRPQEYQRMEQRAILPPPPRPPGGPGEPPRKRDPLLSALPPDASKGVVVFEANALRHSRLGELFLGCLDEGGRTAIEGLRRIGVDPLKDIDRVAVMPDGVAVSGFFDRVRWDQVFEGAAGASRGGEGIVYRWPGPPEGDGMAAAVWRNQLLLMGKDPAAVETALDRVEGRASVRPPLAEEASYGEVYGVLPGKVLEDLVPSEDGSGELARRLAEVARRVELHADAMNDVSLTAKVSGDDRAALEDLAKALGAALALGRAKAQASGDRTLVELLEHARVARGEEGFSLELALPAETLERWFAGCRARGGSPARDRR